MTAYKLAMLTDCHQVYWIPITITITTLIVYRPGYFTVHPPPAPSGPKFSNSENCCGSENAMPPKIFWDMEGHRGHFRSKNVFFLKKTYFEKNS